MARPESRATRPSRDQWISDRNPTWGRGTKGERGVYSRIPPSGPTSDQHRTWGYYDAGKIVRVEGGRADAIAARSKAMLRKAAGLPPVDTRVTVAALIEEEREAQRRKNRAASFAAFEYAADKIIVPEIGHLRPGQLVGNDRLERLKRDLMDGKITGKRLRWKSAKRYLNPLGLISRRAIKRGILSVNLLAMIDEEPDEPKRRFEWSPDAISALLLSARDLDGRPKARYSYAPLIGFLMLTGLRVGEALGLRAGAVDLLGGRLVVQHSWGRHGELGPPKTAAGLRVVPLGDQLVALLASLIPTDADPEDFVFHARNDSRRPISYNNFRSRGFLPAVEAAGLAGSVTIHDLRRAAASVYAKSITLTELAAILGHADASTTARVYALPYDRPEIERRVRAAQASLHIDSP